jgi:hypothetical protein
MTVLSIVVAATIPVFSTHHVDAGSKSRPAIVENGSSVVTYHFPGNGESAIAFAPDGSSFAVVRDGVVKIAPNGAESFLPESEPPAYRGNPDIVYSNGYLWFNVYHGIVRERPDGTGHRYYQLGNVKNGSDYAGPLLASPDGLYFLSSRDEANYPYYALPVIGHIDNAFELTVSPVAPAIGYGYPKLVWSPDNHLDYIGSVSVNNYPKQTSTNNTYMYQLQPDGSSTLLGTTHNCAPDSELNVALGAIYFSGSTLIGDNETVLGSAICRATIHGKFGPITPLTQNAASAIAVDAQADVWSTSLFGVGLYSYNLITKAVTGPMNLQGLVPSSDLLYVGPDQNVYFFAGYGPNQTLYGTYVRHQMVATPNSLSLNSFDNATTEFFITEPVRGGAPWTVRSLDPTIATVTPASSLVGRFHVNEAHVGSTMLVVTDALGNVTYLPVTAN